ncbi:MAG: TonB family protein [Deltaproteobacteria bacterium]|nr:TonB family protein [Deltaproteobacteria bacterium]
MYLTPEYRPRQLNDYLAWALIFSIVAHIAIGFVLTLRRTHPPVESALMVEFVQDPSPPKIAQSLPRQIVSTPDQKQESPDPPLDARLLSDKNFVTPQEKIHRGDAPDAGPVPGKQQAPQAQKVSKPSEAQPKKQQAPAPAKLKDLVLDRDTLLNDFSLPDSQKREDAKLTEEITKPDQNDYRAFTRPSGSGAAFVGTSGLPDYLPNLPDGDITLLNTKANLFAVFVRRVATQVFAQLRSSGWETLRPGDINAIADFVVVRAILSPNGTLLKTEILDRSGSPRFDETVKRAAEIGAKDPNPPKAAVAEDGNIHFIFQSRSWVSYGGNPRTGAPMERRWILLGTGLE